MTIFTVNTNQEFILAAITKGTNAVYRQIDQPESPVSEPTSPVSKAAESRLRIIAAAANKYEFNRDGVQPLSPDDDLIKLFGNE